ncbi:MAG: TonB family protein, partial [Candidatus Omnitrophica bacterium]|nr:TonB family protein [Candidatus Omnitrophota bacterium]
GAENRGGVSKELLAIQQKPLPRAVIPQEKPRIEQPYKLKMEEFSKPQETIAVPKPELPAPSLKKQKITLKELPVETSKDPVYLGYRDIIRKKIQDRVYHYSEQYFYFDYPRQGRVFVSFTLNPNGELVNLAIVENKSSKDNILKKIVTTAIEKSSPFQKFPKDLKREEHSFNLEISFETQ